MHQKGVRRPSAAAHKSVTFSPPPPPQTHANKEQWHICPGAVSWPGRSANTADNVMLGAASVPKPQTPPCQSLALHVCAGELTCLFPGL